MERGVTVKVAAFVVVGLAATSWLGARYAGIDFTDSGYEVTTTLPDTGGLFENGEVTYRGVPIGRVGEIVPTDDGVTATLEIDGSAPAIPASATASVNNRSAIGEQYLDLAGESADGPYLEEGDQVSVGDDALPPEINDLLQHASAFAESVPTEDMQTVIDEAYNIADGDVPQDLRRLLSTSGTFREQATEGFLATSSLIRSSTQVLETQENSAGSIRNYSEDLSLLANTMADSDADIRTLIQRTPGSAQEVDTLFKNVGTPLGLLMNNLVPTASSFGDNAVGLQDAMVRAPEALSIGWAVSGSQGLRQGLVPTFFDPLPCTQGYGGTTKRPGLATSPGRPLNLGAGCTAYQPKGPSQLKAPPRTKVGDLRVADDLADLMGGDR